jgi:hypothetical protein
LIFANKKGSGNPTTFLHNYNHKTIYIQPYNYLFSIKAKPAKLTI